MLGVNRRFVVLGACVLLAGCAGEVSPSLTTPPGTPSNGIQTCGKLPAQAWDTVARVEHGGPYPYPDNDDKRFGNYEGALPKQKSGYYREYTVDTPGVNHRGARRLVTGGGSDGSVDEWFYTGDHYETFCEISKQDLEAHHE